MRNVVLLIAVIGLVAAAAGCGGGKKNASQTTTTAAESTTTAPAATTTASDTTAAPKFASTKNCRELAAMGAKISSAIQASAANGSSSITTEADLFKQMADAAPAEIRGDFQTFAEAFATYAEAFSKAGFKPGKVPTPAQAAALANLSKTFSAPKLVAAEKHLSAWAQKNCGVSTP